MTRPVYCTQFDGKSVEISFAWMPDQEYVIILVKEQGTGDHICIPTVYLPDAPRDKDEVFLKDDKPECHGIIDMLKAEGLIEFTDQYIEMSNDNGYAMVCTLTNKAKNVMCGYQFRDRNEPDKIPDLEFNENLDEDHKHIWTPRG